MGRRAWREGLFNHVGRLVQRIRFRNCGRQEHRVAGGFGCVRADADRSTSLGSNGHTCQKLKSPTISTGIVDRDVQLDSFYDECQQFETNFLWQTDSISVFNKLPMILFLAQHRFSSIQI